MILFNVDVELPERVRGIVDGSSVGYTAMFCSSCRQPDASLRCSRCKIAKYCSADCQKKHFKLHKKNCKSIAHARGKVDESLAGPQWEEGEEEQVRGGYTSQMDDYIQRSIAYIQTAESFHMGDLLVEIGYRESDTIEHGNIYYREALKYYLVPMKQVKEEYFSKFGWIEDRILLLLVVLGGDRKTIHDWCTEIGTQRHGSRRKHYFLGARSKLWGTFDEEGNTPDAPSFGLGGYAHDDDLPFQAIMLLAEMKLLADLRLHQQGTEACKEDSSTEVASENISLGDDKTEMGEMPGRIKNALFAIRYHGNESLLGSIEEDIPLKPEHAPKLFRPNRLSHIEELSVSNNNMHRDKPAPVELWMLYQDCFFEMPSLMNVFNEFTTSENE